MEWFANTFDYATEIKKGHKQFKVPRIFLYKAIKFIVKQFFKERQPYSFVI